MASFTLALALLAVVGGISAAGLGEPVHISQFPSMVQIDVYLGSAVWIQQCAGIVLTNYHILSTATCFTGIIYRPEYRRIHAGITSRGEFGVVAGVLYAATHPDFVEGTYDKDVSVVRIISPLTLGGNIQQGAIVPQGFNMFTGLRVNLVGWGTTAQGGVSSDGHLHKLELLLTDLNRCRSLYEDAERSVTINKLCAGLATTGGRDYDGRDLGAPLFYDTAAVGLLSFGNSNGNDEYPVVALAVGAVSDWIITQAVQI